jgi:2-dehydro-3-deoxygluconokinase
MTDRTPMGLVICFGEMLLRLAPPGRELLLQTPRLETAFGGAEANVAVGLARLGGRSRMVTVLPDNGIGQAAAAELRRCGVDASRLLFAPGRMGLYFLTPGAVLRPAEVLYDRAGSAFANASPDLIDWPVELEEAAWLHISGITPATGASGAATALKAVQAARRLCVQVSFDGNFRSKVWGERIGDAPTVLRDLLTHADVAFIDERDIGLILGKPFDGHKEAVAAAFGAFPDLQIIASTRRKVIGPDEHDLVGRLSTRTASFETDVLHLRGIVDRVGAGDAFCAGLLHGLITGIADPDALAQGLACCALKHGIVGDFPLIGPEDAAGFSAEHGDLRR